MVLRKIISQLCAFIVPLSILLCCQMHHVKPTQKFQQIEFKSATELTTAIRRGQISSLSLLNLYLERIKSYDDDLNAVVALDIAAARTRAAEADKALAQGRNWGPLHGLPMTVKDVFEVVGMPATSGDPDLRDYIPESNALAVQRLVNAGAIIFGKTNVPYHALDIQSYNDIYGATNNPWDFNRTPGGSSGGAAAALAAGFTPLELGSDISGSVRIPAHYSGIFGHKTTFGIIPRYGHIPPMPGEIPQHVMQDIPLFVVGPLARTADDLELALKVLTTPTSVDQTNKRPELLPPRKTHFRDYRVAVWLEDSHDATEIDAYVMAVLQKFVGKLREAGLDVNDEARPDIDLFESNQIYDQILYRLMLKTLPLPEDLIDGQKKLQAKWADFFQRYDVLLAPVSSTVAFEHNHKGTLQTRKLMVNGREKDMRSAMIWTGMAVVSGLPSTVAPVGLSDSGLPVGIQIIGARLEDLTTIDFARGLTELVGGFVVPPGYKD